MEFSEQDFLDLCKTKIEAKYHLGNNGGSRLRQRDFEYLIDLIEETSEIKLSVSTLKRLWRDSSEQNPHPATLDALVSILGYKDWLEFKVDNAPQVETVESQSDDSTEKITADFAKSKLVLFGTSLVIVTLIIISFTSTKSGIPPDNLEDMLFSVNNTVSSGVPNTVIFNYDLEGIEAEEFYIQQDWDPGNREEIDPSAEYFTSIYYYPGFHKARILADETVLKTEDVFIRTEGWLAVAVYNDNDDIPVYLAADSSTGGMLSIREEALLEKGVDVDRFGGAGFFNIRDYGGLDGHNFKSETRFRLRELVNIPCPAIQFTIHTEEDIYFVQFTSMGCVGGIELLLGETYMSGGNNDLSPFGIDVFDWQELSLTVENKFATIFLNGENIFEAGFENDFGKVVGVDYRFSGMGDVDYLRLKKLDDTLVFEDDF